MRRDMSTEEAAEVPRHVAELLIELRAGWRPAARTLGRVTEFIWGESDLLDGTSTVHIERDRLEVLHSHMLEVVLGPDRRALLNKPFRGKTDEDFVLAADSAHADTDRVVGHYWTLLQNGAAPRLWVAKTHGLNRLDGALRNVAIQITEDDAGGSTRTSTFGAHRLEGAYTYYLFQTLEDGSDPKAGFIIVDTGGAEPPHRALVYPDMLALQFVFGQAFYFDILEGIDASLRVVGLVGGRHGRDHGEQARSEPPVPATLAREHWPAQFFAAISRAYRARPQLRLYIALSYFLDSLAGFHVENRYLVLHVALEAFAFWFLGGETGAEQPLVDKPKWKAWLKERRAEIEALAVPGQENSLFGKVTSIPKRRASSRVVQDAFAKPGIELELTEEMQSELDEEGRGRIVHAAIMFEESQADVDAYLRRIALVRTMLVALVARIVGYKGAILGWSREPGRPYSEPDASWWSVDDAAREAALKRYSVVIDTRTKV